MTKNQEQVIQIDKVLPTESSKDSVNSQKEEIKHVKYTELFRYADKKDKIYMTIGFLAAFANGLSLPFFSLIFGDLIDAFGPEYTIDDMVDNSWYSAKWMFALGVMSFVASWIQVFTWMESGQRQAIVFRKKYLEALMKQDIAWFDKTNPNTLASKVAQDCFAIQGAIGEKVPTFILTISMLLGGFAVAFVNGWELALILTAALPLLAIASTIYTVLIQTSDIKVQQAYSDASGITEQAIHGIKTVKALNGQQHEEKNYRRTLQKAYDTAIKYGFKIGGGLGFLWFAMLADYAIGFYFGSIFIGNETRNEFYDRSYSIGDVVACFFSIMMGGFSLGYVAPCLKNFGLGKQAGYRVFQVIDNQPTISPAYEKGEKPANFQGNIELQNVEFTYPTKQDIQVLKSINLSIKAGQKTALVGESGCGKSTIMQLVERFYDADKGNVIVDGHNIKDLNLKYLREHIGYVGQEPVLFATTIEQNLKFGKPDATQEEIIDALKQANAYEFVMGFQDKLETFVGTSGSQLSGGQKQRLCIARAILKNPQILLLDEATSALDRTNERSIQQTLDVISKNRTTIVIAHRLTTVQNSDHIIVIDHGKVVEEGNHETLMQKQGKYAALCQNQIQQEKQEQKQQEEEQEEISHDSYIDEAQIKNKKPHLPAEEVMKNKSILKNESNLSNKHEDNQKEEELSPEEKKALQKQKEAKDKQFLSRLQEINKPERVYMFIGAFFSIVAGLSFPLSGLVMAYMIDILAKYNIIDDDEYRDESDRLSLLFLIIAIVTGIASVFQFAAWQRVAEGLTLRLRTTAFSKICKMPLSWFDEKENNPGTLSSKIGTDTQKLNALTSNLANIQISNLSCIICGLTIGFVYEWRTTLVAIGLFPFIMISGQIQAQFDQGFSDLTDVSFKEAGKIVSETVTNMRTVYSFTSEKGINSNFSQVLRKPQIAIVAKAHKSGLALGLSQLIIFIVYGLQFWLAAIFAREYGTTSRDMFSAIFGVLYAAFGAGNNNQFMGDIGAAKSAARSIFGLIDSADEIQNHQKTNPNPIKSGNLVGNIEFKNVYFKYPTREKIVLRNVSFKINQGDKIAFVGPSGCGKSTIMQLLLRYYEPLGGEIFIDGKEIHEYDIEFLRGQLGVVNQEPILFLGTIQQNIQYNTENLTQKQIEQAAEQANAAKFIQENAFELQDDEKEENKDKNKKKNKNNNTKEQQYSDLGSGYDRQVGTKGSSLSGGQKQRIAIARAIIKQPKILLLDEATSALDTKNEQVVQESLDNIMKNKTTLAIAHRISTIKDSKNIFVMEDGNIVEQGNYEQLQNNKSFFYRLERGETH